MRGGGKKVTYVIMWDEMKFDGGLIYTPINTTSDRNIEVKFTHKLPIFIMVRVHQISKDDFYLFFNKNITSDEITNILKVILENEEVTLDPPIQVSQPSPDVEPRIESTIYGNIDDARNNPSITPKELVTKIFGANLENFLRPNYIQNPFQHFSQTFLVLKSTSTLSPKYSIYSGETTDAAKPLDGIKLKPHTIPNIPDLNERIDYLKKNDLNHGGLTNVSVLTELDRNYIPNGTFTFERTVNIEEKDKPQLFTAAMKSLSEAGFKIKHTLSIKPIAPYRRTLYHYSPIGVDNISLEHLSKTIDINMNNRYDFGFFTPLPSGWFAPKKSQATV
jgi:hypothetical protein